MLQYSQPVGFFCTMKTINEQINPVFVNQAKKLTRIKGFLLKALPIECHKHFQVANIRQQILMLTTNSPVWTTRLRQLSPQILQYIRENSQKFESCLTTTELTETHFREQAISNKSGNKQIIHHIQISTKYHPQFSGGSSRPTNKISRQPEISNKTAQLLTQSANSIDHPQLKAALLKLAHHGNTKLK